jgi:hypothetical protein
MLVEEIRHALLRTVSSSGGGICLCCLHRRRSISSRLPTHRRACAFAFAAASHHRCVVDGYDLAQLDSVDLVARAPVLRSRVPIAHRELVKGGDIGGRCA